MKIFYTIGFYILLLILICHAFLMFKHNPMKMEGQLSWADLYSNNAEETVDFLNTTLGIKSKKVEQTEEMDYTIIKANKSFFPFAGIMQITEAYKEKGLVPHSTLYFTVKDFDETEQKMLDNGAKILVPVTIKENMKFGIYLIPGDVDIAIIEYL